MLKSVGILEEGFGYGIRAFSLGRVFKFTEGINLVLGENGAGKSMMLNAIRGFGVVHRKTVAKIGGEGEFRFLDAEKDNPRTKDPRSMPDKFYRFAIGSRMMLSHGETMKPMLTGFDKDNSFPEGCLVMIDEPEMALSFKTQVVVFNAWVKAVKKKNLQFVVATHSLVFATMKPRGVKVNVVSLDDTHERMIEWLGKNK